MEILLSIKTINDQSVINSRRMVNVKHIDIHNQSIMNYKPNAVNDKLITGMISALYITMHSSSTKQTQFTY